ncbi:MAG: site-specific DNA-methyltransferase [Bacteroidaceae bacterium]|nr:site-specific DNA-methyltransferase [Bacteroidaceae bacterium]
MEKLNMHTQDVANVNIEKIGQLFPNCLTERLNENGKPEMAIDFDKLKQELSKEIVEGNQERYQFTWPGKREAMRLANTPTNMTLRPDRESSVDFDNTENLYIEGDNLEVLKLLRENYLGKVKMIYIDPPYNTGNDFVYEDDFSQTAGEFKDKSGMFDENGQMLLQNYEVNADSNGRFHTDWLNMMYPRLKVAKDLLREDGVIFMSIDDNEAKNLKNIADEIFGAHNFLAQVVWERAFAPINLKKHFSVSHDYILVYAKDIESLSCNGLPRTNEANGRYSNPDNDPRGVWTSDNSTVGPEIKDKVYPITTPGGKTILPPSGRCWLYTKERFDEMIADNRIWFGSDGNNVPRVKRFLSEVKQGVTPMSIWKYTEVGHSQDASQKLKKLFDSKAYFDYPKPVELIKRCIQLYTDKDSIILDFFSGSATTAHSVILQNSEDNGERKFILVQLAELTDKRSEARKDGYENICQIGEERIRRAGKKILEEMKAKQGEADLFTQQETEHSLDIGFRVLKLDTSNMQDVYYTPEKFTEHTLFEDNVKPDRTAEDLLFQVMLECNLPLSAKIEKKTIAGKEVFNVNDGYLLACFDEDVNETVITEVARQKPYYFIMRDKSLSSDQVADNFEQIFNAYSKDTIRRIL